MVVVPPQTAVTKPDALTVAIVVLDDVQGEVVAAVAEPVNWDVKPTHENKVPVIIGKGLIVKV